MKQTLTFSGNCAEISVGKPFDSASTLFRPCWQEVMMRMPFGKYRYRPLEEIPESYLLWVLDNCDNISPTLQAALRQRLGVYAQWGCATARPDWEQLVTSWYRGLCLDFHPDRGGSTVAMQAI